MLSFKRPNKRTTALGAFGVIALFALWSAASFTTAFFWSVFLIWWLFRLDSRILAGVALTFLVFIPILLSMYREAQAEQFAVYVYFLLVITVVLQIFEFRREKATVSNRKTAPAPVREGAGYWRKRLGNPVNIPRPSFQPIITRIQDEFNEEDTMVADIVSSRPRVIDLRNFAKKV